MESDELRSAFAMMILNGMLSRLDPKDIDPEEVWQLADKMIEAKEQKPTVGLPPIKRRKKIVQGEQDEMQS
jgi:hypothetical protein